MDNGTKLGPYEIVSPLGVGGMGEVYRAKDTKLDREVAIKVLPDAFARDPERVARFQREAKVLASLNHPNIASIYGFEESDDKRFLVMELVEGETLSQRIKNGSLDVEETLQIHKQIAEALEIAHENGVIHRDLKPANVMITPEGKVKVLDFGLAKALTGDEDRSQSEIMNSPTITADFTRPGVVMGTAAYMSPEQARGRPLDKRTDIWSFGCVLYECLSGQKPFDGETATDLIAKILERDPDMSMLVNNTPPKIIDLMRRCMEKPQRRRLRDIGDAVLELDDAISTRSWTTSAIMAASGPMYTGSKRRPLILWIILIGLGSLIGWQGSSLLKTPPSLVINKTQERRVSRVSITIPEFIRPDSIRISPVGRLIAAIGKAGDSGSATATTKIFTRSFDDYQFRPVAGTIGATNYCFSPDGKWFAYTTQPDRLEGAYELAKTSVDGSSPPLRLTTFSLDWVDNFTVTAPFYWTRCDEITFTKTNKAEINIMCISTQTGEVNLSKISNVDDSIASLLAFSQIPNRNVMVYNVNKYKGGAWQMSVRAIVDQEKQLHTLTEDGSNGTIISTGHLLYSRGQRLLAVPFDADQLRTIGGPIAMIDGLRTRNSWENGTYNISNDGTLVYLPGGRVGAQRQLTIVNSDGKLTDIAHPGRPLEETVSASRDGQRAVVVITNSAGLYELWITELDVPRLRRFAAEKDGDCTTALWSKDGDYVYYQYEGKNERDGIYRRRADGSGKAELVVLADQQSGLKPQSFSANNDLLIVERTIANRKSLYILRLNGEDKKQTAIKLLLGDSYDTEGADLSPDGKWLAYGSNESGRYELYIRSFSTDGTLGNPIPTTTEGGGNPHWAPDNSLLYFYYRHERKIMALEVDMTTGKPMTTPRIAVDFDSLPVDDNDYSTLPAGKLLMMRKGVDEANPTHVEVIVNWFEELKTRVPTGVKP